MIYLDSRYSNGKIFKAYHSTKEQYDLTVFRKYPDIVTAVVYYEWVDGDRIDLVAEKYFGDSEYWWQILDANPAISNPFEIEPGTVLRIPSVG
jgi:nucleoid-associated protein YgaU